MKRSISLLLASILLLAAACNPYPKPKTVMDRATVIRNITTNENRLFSLLRAGKINEAFAMHSKNADYRNITKGNIRNHRQMGDMLARDAARGITAYNYAVSSRDFLIMDDAHVVLETLTARKSVVNKKDSLNRPPLPIVLSILWIRESKEWNIAYLHSSYSSIARQ